VGREKERYSQDMKTACFTIILSIVLCPAFTQYYYRDLILSKQTFGQMQRFRDAGVRSVSLESFESDGQPTEGFKGTQQINADFTQIITELQSVVGDSSVLISYFNKAGLLIGTSDTADGAGSSTEYIYGEKNRVVKIINTATSKGQATEREEHLWFYGTDGKPVRMLRIKNSFDTAFISFLLDEKGNVAEENPVRKGVKLPSTFYYHDDENRLTDIVSYNEKAKRLLPVYIFDYNDIGLVNSMMVVPEGSDDYQKWYYSYNDDGLKVKEVGYNKRKQLMGTIEYSYSKK
jgi:hypothetical protein